VVIGLLTEHARTRIVLDLAYDHLTCATEKLAALRRDLFGRDPLKRERAASLLPAAQAEVDKWRRIRSELETRRDWLEITIAQEAKALTL
jgi:hypothetical protein